MDVVFGSGRLDDSGKVIPMLATSWTPSADGKSYTFTLGDDAKFSDGTPITSTDVVYSINRSLDPAPNHPPHFLSQSD